MKRVLWLLISISLCAMLAGCLLSAKPSEPTPAPTPAPSPTPAPAIVLAGGAEEPRFADMVRDIAASAACEFQRIGTDALEDFVPAGRTVLIWHLGNAEADEPALHALMSRGVPVYVYAPAGQSMPDDLPYLRYESEKAPAMALSEALAYDNHDTPVRLLGLFSSENSAGAAAFTGAVQDGKVFDKGRYYADTAKKSAAEWLSDVLEDLYPGMLDGIYCESASLARDAAGVMQNHVRFDAEIFSADADEALLALVVRQPALLARAVAADPSEAGRLAAEQALVLLYGGMAQSLTVNPKVFAAS